MAKLKTEGFKPLSKEQKEFLHGNLYNKFPEKFQAELLRRVSLKGLEIFLRDGILEEIVSSEWTSEKASSQDISQVEAQEQDLIKKIDNLFIEGTHKEKLNFIVEQFFKWHERFPYLTIQATIDPLNAGFPPCPFVKAIYWEGDFLGFHCRVIKAPAFDLPRIKIGRLTLRVTTPDDCWDCIELCKKQKVGIDLFQPITLKQIQLRKTQQKALREQSKSQYEREITQKLREGGIRDKNYEDVKALFKHLTCNKKTSLLNEKTKEWKGISNASRLTGTSRPTIYKIIEIFPEGVH